MSEVESLPLAQHQGQFPFTVVRPLPKLLVNLIWVSGFLLVLTTAYVLSYAPVIRWKESQQPEPYDPVTGKLVFVPLPVDGQTLPVYQPVDWLIDHTPLSRPLFWWGDACGCGESMRIGARVRQSQESGE